MHGTTLPVWRRRAESGALVDMGLAVNGFGRDCPARRHWLKRPLMRRIIAAFLALAGLGSASMAAGQPRAFPSLDKRPVELRDRAAEIASASAAAPAPARLDPETLDRIARLAEDAGSAGAAFDGALTGCRESVEAAARAAPGSEAWVVAERAISRLDAARYGSVAALAGLDSLYAAAMVAGQDAAPILGKRATVVALVDRQNDQLDRFRMAIARP